MCIYEYSLLTSCESSAEKLTEVRIFGLDFFFFVSDLYDIGIRVVGTSRSQYKCVHETEEAAFTLFLVHSELTSAVLDMKFYMKLSILRSKRARMVQ